MKKYLITIPILVFGFASVAFALPYFQQTQGLVPDTNDSYYIGTTTPSTKEYKGIVTRDLIISGTCTGCGSGSVFPFTATSYGVSTTTTIGLLNGFISTASSTITGSLRLSSLANGWLTVYGGTVGSAASTTFSCSSGVNCTYAAGVESFTNTGVLSILQTYGSAQTGALTIATSTTAINNDWGITNSAGAFTFNLPTATASIRGLLSSGDWNIFNNKVSSSSLAQIFPFTPTTYGSTAANATSTLIGFTNGIYSTASSTINFLNSILSTTTSATTTNFKATTASTTNLFLATGTCTGGSALQVSTSGSVNCGAVTSSSFGQTFEIDASKWISATTTNSYGINANTSGLTFGYGLGDSQFIYASSTNQTTLLGLNAGGPNSTTSATVARNSVFGYSAGSLLSTGTNNSFFGHSAGVNVTTGSGNIAIGNFTLNQANSGATREIAIGSGALNAGSLGADNISIGFQNASYAQTGAANILIGNSILPPSSSASAQLNIGNVIYGTGLYNPAGTTQSAVPTATGSIGIGSTTPWGQFSIFAGGNYLPAAASTLFAVGSSTAGTATTTHFVINSAGQVGVSTSTPWKQFSVNGNVSLAGLNTGAGAGSLCLTASNEVVYSSAAGCTGGGSLTGSGSAGQATFWTGTSAVSGDNSFWWDNVKKKLGIGTVTPSAPLQVASSSASTNATLGFGQVLLTDTNAGTGKKNLFLSYLNGLFTIGTSTDAFATSTTPALTITNSGQVSAYAVQPATTTSMVLDWTGSPNQVEYRIGTSATTITLINATTSDMWGSRKLIQIWNPGTTAGALTVAGVEFASAYTQTTAANKGDLISCAVSHATSTTAFKVICTAGAGSQ